MDIIAGIVDWIKRVGPKLLIPAIIVLVGLASFGLGRLSGLKAGDRGLIIHTAPQTAEERADYAP